MIGEDIDAGSPFADEHKLLVELACSTTLAAAYNRSLISNILRAAGVANPDGTLAEKNVVFIVCGGVKISLEDMVEYRSVVEKAMSSADFMWEVRCDGNGWKIPA